jgi:hypothetical protein
VGEIAANTYPFLMPLGRGPIASGMVVSEFDVIVNVVADRPNPLPAAGDLAEHCPCPVRELLRVAVSAAQQIRQSLIWQVAHRPLFGLDVYFVRQPAIRDQELVAKFDESGRGDEAGADIAECIPEITCLDVRPLSGSYWGDADDELGMEVTVNVKTEGGLPNPSTAVGAPRVVDVGVVRMLVAIWQWQSGNGTGWRFGARSRS